VWISIYNLSCRYGKDKASAKPGTVVERVINRIKDRSGGGGIKGLQRFFVLVAVFLLMCINRTIAIIDNDGNKRLSKEEFKYEY
jgi:hypothetical protein